MKKMGTMWLITVCLSLVKLDPLNPSTRLLTLSSMLNAAGGLVSMFSVFFAGLPLDL